MEEEQVGQRLATSIEQYTDAAREGILGHLVFWNDHAEDVCESEIEKTFLLAWIAKLLELEHFGCPHGGRTSWSLFNPIDDSPLDPPEFSDPVRQYDLIKCQFKTCGYRTDFALRRFLKVDGKYLIPGPKVLVECDGHDFHERTKEQAQHDKERDRVLQTEGFYVLRFTGSELWRNPAKCAQQVDDFMEEHLSRFVREKSVR